MKRDEVRDRDMMHRVLDGDASTEQMQEAEKRLESDGEFRREFKGLERAVRAVESGERIQAPAYFTASVMRKLPQPSPGFGVRMSGFLFHGRTLRWNMATVLAGLLILVLAGGVLKWLQPGPVPNADSRVLVTMKLYAPDAGTVSVAGTFNKWRTDADLLRKGENGYWTITVPLQPGDYTYMFVVDGKVWVTDPNAESYRDDGFGAQNAVMRVTL